jgi:hypothetical protein
MKRKQGMWAALLVAGVLSLGLNLWLQRRELQQRRRFWAEAVPACAVAGLDDLELLRARLSKARLSKADRAACVEAVNRMKDCWHQTSLQAGVTSGDPFYEPLDRLAFWQAQAIQLAEDSLRLEVGAKDMRRLGAEGLQGMRRNQASSLMGLGRAAAAQLGLSGEALARAQALAALGSR